MQKIFEGNKISGRILLMQP